MKKLILLLSICLCSIAHAQITYVYSLPLVITKPGTYVLGQTFNYSPALYNPAIDVRASNVYINFAGHSIVAQIGGLYGVVVQYRDVNGVPIKSVCINKASLVNFNRGIANYAENVWVTDSVIHVSGENAIGIHHATASQYGLISSTQINGDGSRGQIGVLNESTGNVLGFSGFHNLSLANYINANNPALNIPAGNNLALLNRVTN